MNTQELQKQLLALSIAEKTEILQALIQNLGGLWTGISKKPGIVGGDACIAGTRIPVWDLVEYRRLGASDRKILEAYPQLTAADLFHAWAYADAFPDEINAAIDANEAAQMLRLYADEQFPLPVVKRLREKGFDVLTVKDAGNANQGIPDAGVLMFATSQGRAVITQNRRDFIGLHNQGLNHAGIIVCTKNLDWDGFAAEIERLLLSKESINGELVRVNRPAN